MYHGPILGFIVLCDATFSFESYLCVMKSIISLVITINTRLIPELDNS